MLETYRGGYKRALLDVLEYIEGSSGSPIYLCRGKNEIKRMLTSLLHLLLENPEMLETFLDYGGICEYRVAPDKRILEVLHGHRRRRKSADHRRRRKSAEEKEWLQDRSAW